MGTLLQTSMPKQDAKPSVTGAALAALGIVYGDIGTSPLYALKQAVAAGGTPTPATVMGVVSLILWSLILIVSLKYAILIMRADNRGEGGIMALLALLDVRHAPARSWRAFLLIFGLIGAALLYGDGVITPAISVLSAVEGVKLDAPQLAPAVLPLSIAILFVLFMVQRKGTQYIGDVFGPVMLLWFGVIGLLGLRGIMAAPPILAAVNPLHAVAYLVNAGPGIGFAVLGSRVLGCHRRRSNVCGYGSFRPPAHTVRLVCRRATRSHVELLRPRSAAALRSWCAPNPFYLLAPGWAHYPVVALATLATIIASQAMISGAFSLTQQSMQLGFLPRMRVLHTASHEKGQIYIPIVNWLLAAGTIGAALLFGSSDALGGAYGIAVSLLMAITTVLAALIALHWGFNPVAILLVNGSLLAIELIFVTANATKLLEGGWFPLVLAGAVAVLMLTWRTGWSLLERQRSRTPAERRGVCCLGPRAPAPPRAGYCRNIYGLEHRDPAQLDPPPQTQSGFA